MVSTNDSADIGAYTLRTMLTIYDTTGACTNENRLLTVVRVFIFGMEPQPLEDQY